MFSSEISDGSTIGFASQLHLLVKALEMSSEAKFIEDFISGSEALKSSAVVPPPTVLDRVLKDLFHEVSETQMNSSPTEHKNSRSIKGAPQESLFAQFCLHALWFGNCSIRAISVLWIEFVREVRWCWEESQPLPRMPSNGPIDLSTCLINQKLHMLAVCIDKKHREAEGHFVDADESMATQEDPQSPTDISSSHGASKEGSGRKDQDPQSPADISSSHGASKEGSGRKDDRNDAANVAKSMMLLKSRKIMHAPITLEPPPMTEDMHEERLKAAVALGDSYSFSAQLETEILASDMSAFKAANPDAVFEDFIRWHSPRDWETDGNGVSESSTWPPRGKLSERMSDAGNSWRKIWSEAPAVPASEQKPLWDPNREGEKVLHYLETLRPYQLLEEMVCAAFRAAADTLNQTSFGDLKQMTIKMEQLYITIATVLKIFQAQNTASDTELLEDLRRLCTTFKHIENLILLAASLHVKFLQSPHLGQAIFNDCFNFYLPNMGTSSADAQTDTQREFDKKQQIRSHERDLIISMFPPPTANQSWRKVLSMGNLLNGHEPILREIIFSKRDRVSGSYYAASSPKFHQHDIETYRMYVSGTSNDLGVALAVASFD